MAYTAVFGVVFVDLKGFPDNEYNPRGRNVGRVQVVHGGVSRNVAENLANVGCSVEFVLCLIRMIPVKAFAADWKSAA
jgi:pseudouridine kinase